MEHSILAPAVGYRITAGRSAIFYAPDLVYIYDTYEALAGIRLYVGASLRRAIVRKRGGSLIGHASIQTQLGWCRQHGVRKAAVTHCGSQIVGANSKAVNSAMRKLSVEQGVEIQIAIDGFQVVLP